jgi:hypothetical protein
MVANLCPHCCHNMTFQNLADCTSNTFCEVHIRGVPRLIVAKIDWANTV